MEKYTNTVKVIAFITNDIEDRYENIPDDYLSKSVEIPSELINEMKKNGWIDKEGIIWWRKDFEPKPVITKNGDVYLALSDADLDDEERRIRRMISALRLLK
jgi:hypothetical protein